jgi:hypothetical protein
MLVRLNEEAVQQLESLMQKAGYTNHQHCLQVMISTVTNNLRKAAAKKQN